MTSDALRKILIAGHAIAVLQSAKAQSVTMANGTRLNTYNGKIVISCP